ncbi:MAG: SpoIVB peptidase S55 domain-containing protein [Bacillota bacterium]
MALLLLVIAGVFCVVLIPAQAYGSDELLLGHAPGSQFIELSEIRPGDRGYGKTVFKGTTIETFDVEVLGVTYGETSLAPYIIVRVSGQAIDEAGGIADGMSGSPVYIGGRLAGAISHVYSGDPYTGLVTPISSMLRLLSYPSRTPDKVKPPDKAKKTESIDGPKDAVQLRSPLLVSGLSGRSLELVCSQLAGYSSPIATGNADSSGYQSATLDPGSAMAVQLVDGDIDVSVLGTVTYVDRDSFVAFGHHFEAGGTVDYIASLAEIICIMQSEDQPYKLGAPLDPIGRITQDRFTGLAGQLGVAADTVGVTVRARDLETGEYRTCRFDAINDERFVHSLVTAGVLQAFDSTLGRIGAGTSHVSLCLQLSSGTDVYRGNTYSDWSDIALWSLSEISEAIAIVTTNDFEPVKLRGVTIDAEFTPDVQTARIESAEIEVDEVASGDTLSVRVVLRPYRSQAIVKEVEVYVPEDAAPGYAQLTVQGGSETFGAVPYDPTAEGAYEANGWNGYLSGFVSYQGLDSQLAEFSSRPKNTDLVLDLYLPTVASLDDTELVGTESDGRTHHVTGVIEVQADDEDDGSRESEHDDTYAAPLQQPTYIGETEVTQLRVVVPTDYVVYGYKDLSVMISTADEAQSLPDS